MNPKKKYWHGVLKITCGEYEFLIHKLIDSVETLSEAIMVLDQKARYFYGEPEDGFEDERKFYPKTYYFNCGEVSVSYFIGDKITAEEFIYSGQFFISREEF